MLTFIKRNLFIIVIFIFTLLLAFLTYLTYIGKSLIELNKQCFKIMGDMNWHAHCGITTYPYQIAVNFKIELIEFYGRFGKN